MYACDLQTGDTLPTPFPLPNYTRDPWSPLRFESPTEWRDAMAEAMWRDYLSRGDFVEVITACLNAVRRAQNSEVPQVSEVVTPLRMSGIANDPTLLKMFSVLNGVFKIYLLYSVGFLAPCANITVNRLTIQLVPDNLQVSILFHVTSVNCHKKTSDITQPAA